MKTFEKIYIGKGKQVANLNIVKVTCKLEDLVAIAYEMDGIRYVTFEIAKMKAADTYGRTHSAYYSKMQVTPDAPKLAKKTSKAKGKKNQPQTAEPLPF
jgi:hypothetical protein